jgi:hypothetical protein
MQRDRVYYASGQEKYCLYLPNHLAGSMSEQVEGCRIKRHLVFYKCGTIIMWIEHMSTSWLEGTSDR